MDAQIVKQEKTLLGVIERAISSGASIEALERLMDLHERWEAKEAEKAFYSAMSACQAEINPVKADKENKQTRSKFAGIVAIDNEIRHKYTAHGFSISFNTTKSEQPDHLLVTALVMHSAGHSKLYQIDIPADGKGAKGGEVMAKVHATMSATTYGQRGLIKMIFNIASGEFDDDGNAAAGLTQTDLRDAQLNKIVDLATEMDKILTEKERKYIADIVTQKTEAKYLKAIKFLESKKKI